jgi:hypothetical protein
MWITVKGSTYVVHTERELLRLLATLAKLSAA